MNKIAIKLFTKWYCYTNRVRWASCMSRSYKFGRVQMWQMLWKLVGRTQSYRNKRKKGASYDLQYGMCV